MDIFDGEILGRLTDEIDSEIPQTVYNAENLYYFDMQDLRDSIYRPISKYELKDFYEKFQQVDADFWVSILVRIIHRYQLKVLKKFLNDFYRVPRYDKEVKELLWFLKVSLPEMFLNKELDIEMTIEDLDLLIKKDDTKFPYLFKWFVFYTDKENYEAFLSIVHDEVMQNK